MPTLAQHLSACFCSDAFRGLNRDVLGRMTPYLLDTIAVAVAGSQAPSSRVLDDALLADGSSGVTVYGTGKRASVGDAALMNAAAAHALELDDDHRIAVLHPGAVVVPAVLAVAEFCDATGLEVLRATLVGYEVAIRVGMVFQGSIFEYGLHPTPICGAFGAAAASASLLGLNADGFTRALAIAGTMTAGSTEWRADGSWIKRLNPGHAARSGITAALLARKGFTGPASIFEGQSGVFRALSQTRDVDREALARGLGDDFHAFGTAIKPYPCCRFAHGTIDLAIAAAPSLAGRRPERITLRIYRTDALNYREVPLNAVDAQFNLPYLTAVALTRGAVKLSDLAEAAIRRPEILDLTHRTTVIEDEAFTKAFPQVYNAALEIAFADGSRIELRSNCPSGDPEAEAYRSDPHAFLREAVDKARSLLGECGFGDRAEELIARTLSLSEAASVRELAALMGAPPAHADAVRP